MLLHTAKEKAKERAAKLQGAELLKFYKGQEALQKRLDKISEEIVKADTMLRKLHEVNHTLANIETELADDT